ncbi:MAG TPA: VOC family protein [Gemmatimonadota bacterium]|jgi:lactoylglutathione lyase
MTDLLINIDVDDLEKGAEFYVRALGLRPGRRFGGSGIELLGAPSPIYLLVKGGGTPPFPGAPSTRDYRRHWTPVHLDVAVGDLEAAVGRAVSAGAALEGEIQDLEWGRIATLADPFGHGFCLLQFRGRGYDEIADGPSD